MDDMLAMIVSGTRAPGTYGSKYGGYRRKRRASGSKSRRSTSTRMPRKRRSRKMTGGSGMTYIKFVKAYHKKHPRLSWHEAMIKASPSYHRMKY